MKKTLISTAIATVMFAGSAAHAATSGPDIYGEINLTGEYVSDSYDTTAMEDDSEKTMKSRDTFIGVKGAQGLDHRGLDLVYDVQVGFDFDSQTSDDDFELRKADVGVAGDRFSVHAGRLENPYSTVTTETDLFKNSLASSHTVVSGGNIEHLDKTVALYATPTDNLTLGTSYTHDATEEDLAGDFAFDFQTLTANYDLGMANIYAGYQELDFEESGLADEKSYKLGTSMSPAQDVHVNLVAERLDLEVDEQDSVLAQVGYSMDKVLLKGAMGYIGSTDFSESGNMYAVGADYQLGENTTVGATYANIDTDTLRNLDGYTTGNSASNDGFSVGLSHKF